MGKLITRLWLSHEKNMRHDEYAVILIISITLSLIFAIIMMVLYPLCGLGALIGLIVVGLGYVSLRIYVGMEE